MNVNDKAARAIELLDKLAYGSLTEDEELELASLNGMDGNATDGQREYITDLLDKLGADLEDYTDTPLEDLSFDEASELIDELKEALDDMRHDEIVEEHRGLW